MSTAAFGEGDPHAEPMCRWVLDEDNHLVAQWSLPQDPRVTRAHKALPRPRHRARLAPRARASRP